MIGPNKLLSDSCLWRFIYYAFVNKNRQFCIFSKQNYTMKLLKGLSLALCLSCVHSSQAKEFSTLDLELLYELLNMVQEKQAQESMSSIQGGLELRHKVASASVETTDHFEPNRVVKYVNSSQLQNVSVEAAQVKEPKKIISAGVYFDAIKNNDEDDDDCDGGKWFWPFSVGNSTAVQPRIPTSFLVSYASNNSHGLFTGRRHQLNATTPVNTTHTTPTRATLAPVTYVESPMPFFVHKSDAQTLVFPGLLYIMVVLLLSY